MKLSFLLKLFSFAMPWHTSYSLSINDTADCIAHPDPHMTTFDGISYDYQHGCDVDLVDATKIKIQLRLKKNSATSRTFSSIERLAMHFPLTGETLEINSDGQHYLNPTSNPNPNPIITTIGGYTFTKTFSTGEQQASYRVDLLPYGHFVQIDDLPSTSGEGGLGILIRGHGSLFYDAIGMCGKWNAPAPGLYDRNDFDMLPSLLFTNPLRPYIIDGSSFGDSWQVQVNQLNHISTMGLPFPGQHSLLTCVARRRLQKEERALQNWNTCDYCLGLNNLVQRENCEYDFRVTGDCSWLQQLPFYKKEDTLWYGSKTCCFRTISTKIGFTFEEIDPEDADSNSFVKAPCEFATGNLAERCYQKKSCLNSSSAYPCLKMVQCEGDKCVREANCFNRCVRREQVETGYQLSTTQESGYFYDKCPHNDLCFEIKTCVGTQQECYVRKECNTNFNDDVCYKDVPCPDPCDDPTVAPSPSPTRHNISPTSTPTASQTESPSDDKGDPWKCIGCEWMHSIGNVIPSGQNVCKIGISVAFRGRDGMCEDNDGACKDIPCDYQYQVEYSIRSQCATYKVCKLIVSDAYTSGTTPAPPTITKIEEMEGIVNQNWTNVKCVCKTNTKLFKIQCEIPDIGISSQSIQVDYACSECNLMWLPRDEL